MGQSRGITLMSPERLITEVLSMVSGFRGPTEDLKKEVDECLVFLGCPYLPSVTVYKTAISTHVVIITLEDQESGKRHTDFTTIPTEPQYHIQ